VYILILKLIHLFRQEKIPTRACQLQPVFFFFKGC
jgi:hypothetical protein